MASAQLGIGLLYVFPLWLTKLRKAPKLAKGALKPLRCATAVSTLYFIRVRAHVMLERGGLVCVPCGFAERGAEGGVGGDAMRASP